MVVSAIGLRTFLISKIPRAVMLSTAGGIGLFLAFIGMQGSEGLGVVTYNSATLVTLGGCAPAYRTQQYTIPASALATPQGGDTSLCQLDPTTHVVSANGGLLVPAGACVCAACESGQAVGDETQVSNLLCGLIRLPLLPRVPPSPPSPGAAACRKLRLPRWRHHAQRDTVAGHRRRHADCYPHGQECEGVDRHWVRQGAGRAGEGQFELFWGSVCGLAPLWHPQR